MFSSASLPPLFVHDRTCLVGLSVARWYASLSARLCKSALHRLGPGPCAIAGRRQNRIKKNSVSSLAGLVVGVGLEFTWTSRSCSSWHRTLSPQATARLGHGRDGNLVFYFHAVGVAAFLQSARARVVRWARWRWKAHPTHSGRFLEQVAAPYSWGRVTRTGF